MQLVGTLNAEQGGVLARNRTIARSPNLGAIWETFNISSYFGNLLGTAIRILSILLSVAKLRRHENIISEIGCDCI